MGAILLGMALFIGAFHEKCHAMELAPIDYIPRDLLSYFRPEDLDEEDHPGFVSRQRRATGTESDIGEEVYTLYALGGAPCIQMKTNAIFNLDYITHVHGIRTVRVELPPEPEISGSCVREGDTAVLTMRWSVFNFSLVYTENPEGNSYYLNTCILKYNQSLDIFWDASYRGEVKLQTRQGKNFYFTPLGKSYACEHGEDQGPLALFNVHDEKVGNMTLYKTKVQPFVKRAKGEWGQERHCLPKSIQMMRENVVPYVTSLVFVAATSLVIAGYGIYRSFFVKKTDYSYYEEGQPGQPGATTLVEGHEMTNIDDGNDVGYGQASFDQGTAPQASVMTEQTQEGTKVIPAASNPFKKDPKSSSNPFNQ